jgi:hypothetical protein
MRPRWREPYAAVAAKISILFADVKVDRTPAKTIVNAIMIPIRFRVFLTKYRTRIVRIGIVDDKIVVMMEPMGGVL